MGIGKKKLEGWYLEENYKYYHALEALLDSVTTFVTVSLVFFFLFQKLYYLKLCFPFTVYLYISRFDKSWKTPMQIHLI